jgi:hypothetical protein
MGPATRVAEVTVSAGAIDFADHEFPGKFPVGGNDLPDELMTEDSIESHIPLNDLKVGITDGGIKDPDEYFVLTWFRRRDLSQG